MMGYGWPMGGGLGMVLFWLAIIVLVILLARGGRLGGLLGSGDSSRPRRDKALDVLRERFARGEIDLEEYERRKVALTREEES